MNREQEQQLVDYYSATDKYIKSALHSQAHQSVFTKESDKFQWLVLEQKSLLPTSPTHTPLSGRTKHLRPIPFRNLMSATANRGQSAQSRGNGQGR